MNKPASRAWIRLPSGNHLDLIKPDPTAWSNTDLAIRLGRTYRWAGESIWANPLSVAQHSLLVLNLRRQWSETPLTREEALLELLHDAEEGFLGFDCISPLKEVLGQSFKTVSSRLTRAVLQRYEIKQWAPNTKIVHKQADLIAAASEAVQCVGWTEYEVRSVLGITHPILNNDPLAAIYDCRSWEPWSTDIAAERFLTELTKLTTK